MKEFNLEFGGCDLMMERWRKDILIFMGCTLFLLLLCATVGITDSTPPPTATAKAAQDQDAGLECQERLSDRVSGPEAEKGVQHLLEP